MYKCKRSNLVWNCRNACTIQSIRNRWCACAFCVCYLNVSHWYVFERHWFWYNHLYHFCCCCCCWWRQWQQRSRHQCVVFMYVYTLISNGNKILLMRWVRIENITAVARISFNERDRFRKHRNICVGIDLNSYAHRNRAKEHCGTHHKRLFRFCHCASYFVLQLNALFQFRILFDKTEICSA